MPREHPRYSAMAESWPDYEYREYPLMVYPGAKDQAKPYDAKGRPLKGIVVNNDEERDEALGATAPETVQEGGVTRLKTEADDHAELLAQAEVMGVKVDKRWGVARLQDAIDTHRAGKDVV